MVLVCNNILNIFVMFSEDEINIFPSDAVCGLYTILTRGDIGGGSKGILPEIVKVYCVAYLM